MSRLLLLVLLSLPLAHAQSAVDYYHDAARLYVDGNTDAAERAAEAGLALAPGDARLQALLDRIRQQEQQQDQQHGGEQDQQQQQDQRGGEDGPQGEEGQSPPQDGEQQEDPEQPEDSGEGAATDRMDQPPEEREEEQASPEPQDEQGREDDAQQAPAEPEAGGEGSAAEQAVPVEPGRMTRAEAERILSALGADERALLRNLRRTPARPRRVERDW